MPDPLDKRLNELGALLSAAMDADPTLNPIEWLLEQGFEVEPEYRDAVAAHLQELNQKPPLMTEEQVGEALELLVELGEVERAGVDENGEQLYRVLPEKRRFQ
jgi:hypothetical protein